MAGGAFAREGAAIASFFEPGGAAGTARPSKMEGWQRKGVCRRVCALVISGLWQAGEAFRRLPKEVPMNPFQLPRWRFTNCCGSE